MHSAFQQNHYLLKRQVLALTGKFRIFSQSGTLLLYCQQKIFRWKEDLRVFSDESKTQELLSIQARQVIDFSASYDVYDSLSSDHVGTLSRKGVRSMTRDTWQVFNTDGTPVGILQEDSLRMAFVRRILGGGWIPQNYDLLVQDMRVADFKQRFNPLRYELELNFSLDTTRRLDRRLGIAAGLLIATIEGRQN